VGVGVASGLIGDRHEVLAAFRHFFETLHRIIAIDSVSFLLLRHPARHAIGAGEAWTVRVGLLFSWV
jgi:hypothetical protein